MKAEALVDTIPKTLSEVLAKTIADTLTGGGRRGTSKTEGDPCCRSTG